MILNNYYYHKAYISGRGFTVGSWVENVDIGMKGLNGNAVGMVTGVFASDQIIDYVLPNWLMKVGLVPIVGNGTSEPALDDYNLESDITASFSNFAYSVVTSFENGKVETTIVITGTNTTENDLTIREIGIKKPIIASSNQGGTKDVLFIRHLLSQPKTVASGDGFTLAFKWTES